MTNTELHHHGVKGMKWGVRRYENADGTLTSAGKKRYSASKYNRKTAGKHRKKSPYSQKKYDEKQPEKKRLKKGDVEKAAASALDKVSTYLFFHGDNLPNNFAVQRGLDTLSDGLKDGKGVYGSTLDALDAYQFFAH